MDDECLVCKEPYSEEKIPFEIECGHIFCKYCILDVFKRDSRCPLCRREYDIIIKLKEESVTPERETISPLIRNLLRRLPADGNTQDVLNRVELLFHRICRNVERIVTIIYTPSCKVSIRDYHLEANLHFIVVIFITMTFWLILNSLN